MAKHTKKNTTKKPSKEPSKKPSDDKAWALNYDGAPKTLLTKQEVLHLKERMGAGRAHFQFYKALEEGDLKTFKHVSWQGIKTVSFFWQAPQLPWGG